MRHHGMLPAHLLAHTWTDTVDLGLLALIGFGLIAAGGWIARTDTQTSATTARGIASVVAGLGVLMAVVAYHSTLP